MIGLKFAEKTTGMKTIEFKRTTMDGIERDRGELLEWQGFQFGLTDIGNSSMAIELSTGATVYDAYSIVSTRILMNKTIGRLKEIGTQRLIEAMERFKKEYPEFTYPVNEPIK